MTSRKLNPDGGVIFGGNKGKRIVGVDRVVDAHDPKEILHQRKCSNLQSKYNTGFFVGNKRVMTVEEDKHKKDVLQDVCLQVSLLRSYVDAVRGSDSTSAENLGTAPLPHYFSNADGAVTFEGNKRVITVELDEHKKDVLQEEDYLEAPLPHSFPPDAEYDSNSVENFGTEKDYLEAPLPHSFPSDAEYDSDIGYIYEEEDIQDFYDEDNQEDTYTKCLLDFYPERLKRFRSMKDSLSKQGWKGTWPMEGETVESAWVHVYGFYCKERLYGGYGVILRNMSAKPIAASVHFSLDGVSYLYQVLKGLDAGLKLALKYGCSSPRVVCNSAVVVRLLRAIASDSCHKFGCWSLKVNNVCQSCTLKMVPYMNKVYFENVEPLLETLQGKLPFLNFTSKSRKWNKAAYYLAKQAKRTLLIFGMDSNNYKADIKPEEFSEELLDILWSDAYDSVHYNLDEMAMIFDGAVPSPSLAMKLEDYLRIPVVA